MTHKQIDGLLDSLRSARDLLHQLDDHQADQAGAAVTEAIFTISECSEYLINRDQ
jgi:hypothetical protein